MRIGAHVLLLYVFAVAACTSDAASEQRGPQDASPDTSPSGDGGLDGVAPPDGCDPTADPKDAPKCVVSEYGLFVDATTGNDTNSGSKELR